MNGDWLPSVLIRVGLFPDRMSWGLDRLKQNNEEVVMLASTRRASRCPDYPYLSSVDSFGPPRQPPGEG